MIHPWSKLGVMYTEDHLKAHFVNTTFPFEENQIIPQVPSVNLPSRQKMLSITLGTVSHDVQKFEQQDTKNNIGTKRIDKGRVKVVRLRWNVPNNHYSKN